LLSGLRLKNQVHNCFYDEVISLLDFGIPRDAMTFGAPEIEALYEGYAQKGFGVPSLDGAPFRWAPCGGGGSPRCHRAKNPWIKKHSNPNIRV